MFVISNLFILVYEDNTYNIFLQRNYFQKQSSLAYLQICVLQIGREYTGEYPYGNAISKKIAWHIYMDALLYCWGFAEHLFRRKPLGHGFWV